MGVPVILSKKCVNVLVVLFNSKLQWSADVNKAVFKTDRALNAIMIIRKHFIKEDLIQLLTSNYFSILWYNSEVWNASNISANSRHDLFVASANALKMCLNYPDRMLSFMEL